MHRMLPVSLFVGVAVLSAAAPLPELDGGPRSTWTLPVVCAWCEDFAPHDFFGSFQARWDLNPWTPWCDPPEARTHGPTVLDEEDFTNGCAICPDSGDPDDLKGGNPEAASDSSIAIPADCDATDAFTNDTLAVVQAWYDDQKCTNAQWVCPYSHLAPLAQTAIEVLQLVRVGDAGGLAELVESAGGRVYFNQARQAIQGQGCSAGVVSFHVPVSDAVAAGLVRKLGVEALIRQATPVGARRALGDGALMWTGWR